MANRSYLYSIEFDRTVREREKGEKIIGLSEYAYSIPLAYKILVSENSKISKSINWDYEHPIAIIGDFKKGRKRLYDFLKKLSDLNLFDSAELGRQIAETEEFLNAVNLDFVILECAELFEMEDEELEVQNKELYNQDILQIEKRIQEYLKVFTDMKSAISKKREEIQKLSKSKKSVMNLIFASAEKKETLLKECQDLEQEMWGSLGISFWSNTLYYDFTED